MPLESILATALVVAVFATFGVALSTAARRAGPVRPILAGDDAPTLVHANENLSLARGAEAA